ncbi:phytanoyl-CoA dioxygenase family protein [Stutzerimonas kirkiae]|nr:phytanoyl-CoA dioxygenase family protein [Stutzerimonas kirkiae]
MNAHARMNAHLASPLLDSFAFSRDGFLLLRGCLPTEVVDRHLATVAAQRLRSEYAAATPWPAHPAVRRLRHTHAFRASGGLDLALHERLLASLNILAGESCFLLDIGTPDDEQVLCACNASIGPSPHLGAWIALRDIPLEAGLRVWPGSHARTRECLRRLLASEPGLASRIQRMREDGVSLQQWFGLEAQLLQVLRERSAQGDTGMRVLALRKGDVLVQQQGLVVTAKRLDSHACLVARFGADQLHRNHYFADAAF